MELDGTVHIPPLRPPALPATGYPVCPELLPRRSFAAGRFSVRFAASAAELDAVQKLRFEVFNLELGEGLQESFATGRDRDRFDPVCHHLIVANERDEVVGTYRMQTGEMARRHGGFYSADEFDLGAMPGSVMESAVEVGRASVAREYRNRHVLYLLWRGLAAYMTENRKRYLFGCCSLTSQDVDEGYRVMRHLETTGHVVADFSIAPLPGWECYDPAAPPPRPRRLPAVKLPRLFRTYLRHGARVCGPPAIDRRFKTIDYLVLMDIEALAPEAKALFFG